jgi:hypothetical protein
MSHMLHREGTYDSLMGDFTVIQIPGQKRTMKGTAENNRKFIQLAIKNHAVNFNHETLGAKYTIENAKEILSTELADGGGVHAVFTKPENVANFLRDLREAKIGYSTVVSGLMDVVGECCKDAGLQRHSVNLSLGIHGKTEKLIPDDIRPITSMCGHGMVTGELVLQMVDGISKKNISAQEAAEKLASLCPCGVFNPVRAEALLTQMVETKQDSDS